MSAHISAILTKIVPYPSSKSTLDVVLQKGSYENVDIMVPGCFLKAPHVVIGTRSREFTLFYFSAHAVDQTKQRNVCRNRPQLPDGKPLSIQNGPPRLLCFSCFFRYTYVGQMPATLWGPDKPQFPLFSCKKVNIFARPTPCHATQPQTQYWFANGYFRRKLLSKTW